MGENWTGVPDILCIYVSCKFAHFMEDGMEMIMTKMYDVFKVLYNMRDESVMEKWNEM